MNKDLLRKLSAAYVADPTKRGDDLTDRLGFSVREQRKLTKEIHSNFDTVHKGMRVLSAMDFRRRVLIGDTLYAASLSIATNLFDAALHLRELESSADAMRKSWALRLQPKRGAAIAFTPPAAPMEDVLDHLVDLHLAGFFRAAASVLDCLGITCIGVLGIPAEMLKGGWKDVVGQSVFPGKPRDLPGERLQRRTVAYVRRKTENSGPKGWDSWTLDMRNMYVHRPRRLMPRQATPVAMSLLSGWGPPHLRTAVDLLLPREAGRCDPDVMREDSTGEELMLSEATTTTVAGVLRSVNDLSESVCRRLRRVWCLRRVEPKLIEQPSRQWSEKLSARATHFDGYAPGSLEVSVDAFMTGTDAKARFEAAAILDKDRHLWAENPWVP